MTKVHRAFRELAAIGAVEDRPFRISGAQAEGCSPVARAFAEGIDEVRPMKPGTIARSLAIGSPADGAYAIHTARETGGAIDACTEAEVIDGIRLLAETEGVFTETAGGVTVSVLRRLVEAGVIRRDEETVALITGNGYKTIEALEGTLEPSYHVRPDLDEFLAVLED
jgi:threonine synthase